MACLVAGCGTPPPSPEASSGPGAPPAAGAVSVSGNQLLRDRQPWVAHGVISIAFVAPPGAATGVFAQAYQHFGPDEMAAARAWGADSIRLQVSQPGLDPQNPLYSDRFVAAVVHGVEAARHAGLTVVLSVQDEAQSGEKTPTALPNDATNRVWAGLAPHFAHDPGVLYEILNEPQPPPDPANWAAWRTAMNRVISTIRGTGSHNVLVADGLLFAERLSGAPALDDPDHAVVYASHPYAHDAGGQTSQAWDQRFGTFAQTHPVLVTEWTTVPSYYCDADTPEAARAFLSYLDQHHIGLTAYAFDFAGDKFGSIVHGFQGDPSTFSGTSCGGPGFGPGRLVQAWYRTGAVPAHTE